MNIRNEFKKIDNSSINESNYPLNTDDLKAIINEDHTDTIESGYAGTIFASDKDNFSWLIFKDVEDHIDGQGFSSIYLIQGNGSFYYDYIDIKMNIGDIFIFSDNIEHGFETKEECIALNISWGKHNPSEKEVINQIKNCIEITQKHIDSLKPVSTFKIR